MKRISDKRRALNAEADPWRRDFAEEVGHCEWGKFCRGALQIHEISQGPSRAKSLMNRSCILCLCWECHELIGRMPEKRAVGLAILYHSRPSDYSLSEFWRVEAKRKPTQAEVDRWIDRLTRARRAW